MARESCTELNQIVDQLLDVARSERGTHAGAASRRSCSTSSAREVVERFRAAAAGQADPPRRASRRPVGIRILGDPDRLRQVLGNLLSNAIKFTPEGGVDRGRGVRPAGRRPSHVGVSVCNNGEPIPEDARERIFEQFERLDAGDRQVGGTGLGLSISRAIVEAHGGRIWVEPRTDGTKFVLHPARRARRRRTSTEPAGAIAEPRRRRARRPARPCSWSTTTTTRALLLKGMLMGAGHEVLVAADADDALAAGAQPAPGAGRASAPALGRRSARAGRASSSTTPTPARPR